ncbi:ABC-type spermidine/putrescine transport system, permease component II [Mesorhizobium prunaredense]|uniref:ABC-type spermidine/putrescine transport system, permease component II n=1 Tax=Mesorhizobium prunaredense TaxID=1631249 RepID=A0A1R3V1I9_9HYPH|nr:ABC transporter permease [Mesorhizobium prunaredense]SIT53728.1 ABC-type spermidine/putrescine transport system, permease component II [Mesorhizobium prunaredense]
MLDSTRIWLWGGRLAGALVLGFLLLPIFAIVPLSFNGGSILAYPLQGLSLKWYAAVTSTPRWLHAVGNSLIVAVSTVAIATPLGTLAALGLDRIQFPGKSLLMALLISPMIVPVIITAVGVYFFFAPLGLANSLTGLVLAHAVIAVPLVLVTVNASVSQLDRGLLRAAESLGASPMTTFRKITVPLILPGIVSGTIFAFAASFDEVVIALMITGPGQKTLPRELLSGTRENLDPTVLAVASILIAISAGLLLLLTLVQHRSAKHHT